MNRLELGVARGLPFLSLPILKGAPARGSVQMDLALVVQTFHRDVSRECDRNDLCGLVQFKLSVLELT